MVPRCPEQERFPKASSGSAGAVGSVGVGIRLGTGERGAGSGEAALTEAQARELY